MLTESKQMAEAAFSKECSIAFVVRDINQNLQKAETFINQDITVVTNKQLLQIKKDVLNIIEKLEKISDKYEKILQLPINDKEAIQVINGIGMSYEKLNSSKKNFVDSVNKEYVQRELDKDYTTKHLNIKLEKFVGYD